MNTTEITRAIISGTFSNDELNSIVEAIKFARAQLGRTKRRELRVGATVKFTSSRDGRTYTGTVDRIKTKFVLVNTPSGRWNVPANMLETV